MAGFFGFFDYTKPGPGVPKNAPPKPRIKVFFEIYFRKFWHLVKINMLFFVFNLPEVIFALIISQVFLQDLTRSMGMQSNDLNQLVFNFAVSAFFICLPIITVGPAQAGFTYVLRNFAREEHAFLWGDFKEHALSNMKQSLIVCIIDIIILIVVGVDLNFYFHLNQRNLLHSILIGLTMLMSIIYIMMHLYIYPMMVTFKLSIKQIYKNAFIFSIIRFLPNLGIIAVCFILSVLPVLIVPPVGILLFFFITISTVGLITNFYVYPSMKKFMIDKVQSTDKEVTNE